MQQVNKNKIVLCLVFDTPNKRKLVKQIEYMKQYAKANYLEAVNVFKIQNIGSELCSADVEEMDKFLQNNEDVKIIGVLYNSTASSLASQIAFKYAKSGFDTRYII